MKLKSDNIVELPNDILGRENIANEVVNGLLTYAKKNKDGLSLSITGEWGSGKSTLLGFIKNKIEKREPNTFKVISFNPWLFYKNEGIKEAFLIHLALSLKDLDTRTTKISEKVNDFLKAFRWLKYFSATAGNIQEGLETLSDHLSTKENIHDIKEDIEKILRKSKKKILVIMDDVDRLSSEQIAELFQTITLVTNFSNIIYIVAFDREIVIEAIGRNFNGKGQEYLEKVIQVDYEIPSIPDKKLQELFYSNIRELAKENKIIFDDYTLKSLWGYHGLRDYFKSIRDFNRFFNALSFRFPSIADDINPVDFIAIEAIRIFDYQSYNRFYSYYKLNARKRELPDAGLNEEQFQKIKQTAAEIIRALSIKSTLHVYRKEANLKHLLDPAYFDRYFNLMRNDSDISEKDLREIISRSGSARKGILQEAIRFNRIENMIRRLGDRSLHKVYQNYDYSLIRDLTEFFNQNSSLFEEYNDRAADMLINLICGNKKKKQLLQDFFQSFEQNTVPPSIVHIYFFHYIRMFTKDDRGFRNDHRIFDDYYKKNYAYIENLYLPRFKSATNFMWESRQTQSCPFVKYLFQINYAQIFPEEYPAILQSFSNDKNYLLYLAGQFVKIDEDDLTLHRYNWMLPNDIFPNNTFLEFYKKIGEIEPESLNDRQKAIRRHLLALDISKFPVIKYPPEPKMIMAG
ncbi:MAG TPA: P-loop NTPase fold protein [Chitinophagaceae bacterium]